MKILIALTVLAGLALTSYAQANGCTTTCYGGGNTRTCNTYCY